MYVTGAVRRWHQRTRLSGTARRLSSVLAPGSLISRAVTRGDHWPSDHFRLPFHPYRDPICNFSPPETCYDQNSPLSPSDRPAIKRIRTIWLARKNAVGCAMCLFFGEKSGCYAACNAGDTDDLSGVPRPIRLYFLIIFVEMKPN